MKERKKESGSPAGKIRIWHCAAVLFSKVPKKWKDLDFSLLYILILGTCGKFARKNNFLALGVCFPQTCWSAGRRFAVSRSLLHYYWRIVSFPQQQIGWNAFWTGFHLRIRVRLRSALPHHESTVTNPPKISPCSWGDFLNEWGSRNHMWETGCGLYCKTKTP